MSAEYEAFREISAHRKLAPQRERVTAMRMSGMCEEAIADELGASRTTVHYALAFWGVKPEVKVQYRNRGTTVKRATRCGRCEVLLAYAPKGNERLCGWCLAEVADPVSEPVISWGPLLPSVDRVVRDGPPICELLLGG